MSATSTAWPAPDVDPEIWPDDRRLGKVAKLEVRADGRWGYAEWKSLGRENQAEELWVYPSPRWDAPQGKARFEPDRLISVGLTNTSADQGCRRRGRAGRCGWSCRQAGCRRRGRLGGSRGPLHGTRRARSRRRECG
jgi:hypothetical protein